MQQLVDSVAAELEISFQGDDTADHVTRDMIFPTSGDQNTVIQWTSGNQDLLSNYGNIFRKEQAEDVTVTARVSKDGRTASKQFTVHITAAEVPPTPIDNQTSPKEDTPEGTAYFTDLSPVASWAGEAIEQMYALGIVKGTGGTHFSPQNPVTRADFLTMLMRMFQPQGAMGSGFTDVPETAYYYEPVVMAQGMGIATGVGHGRFDPQGQISRQDMITLTYRAMETMGCKPTAPGGEDLLNAYPDGGDTADYAREAMGAMLTSYYINGKGQLLDPQGSTTRAEAATFLYRIFQDVLEVDG